MAIELIRQVVADSDDCTRRLTADYFTLTATYIVAGWAAAANKQWGTGMRFTNITIPQGSTIIEAHLTLQAQVGDSGTVVKTRISAEDIDDAPTFVNNAAIFDARWAARTMARVDWDAIPGWTADVEYDSPDIKTVIKEIVDRPGWDSGQDIVIFWEDFEDRSGTSGLAFRRADSHEESALTAPKLVITYTELAKGMPGLNPALMEVLH